MIRLDQVSKTFFVKKNKQTLPFSAVLATDLVVEKGEIFGIIGASGAGKSTLIRCVNFLERPTTGRVMIDGIDLGTLSESKLNQVRQKIGMIFQHFNLLHSRTVFDNIALPLELNGTAKSAINERVLNLLDLVGLKAHADQYPASLSGGQKQRVAIARALANNPKILLCDEATSALDPATTNAILDLLKKINKSLGITILLITHEMEVVKRICHKVAIMDKGQLIEQGRVGDIFANAKTTLAKTFIENTLHIALPDEYTEQLSPHPRAGDYPVIQFSFGGEAVDLPLFSQASMRYGVAFNILNSQIDYIDGIKFGFSISEVMGNPDQIDKALDFFQQHHIRTRVLGWQAATTIHS